MLVCVLPINVVIGVTQATVETGFVHLTTGSACAHVTAGADVVFPRNENGLLRCLFDDFGLLHFDRLFLRSSDRHLNDFLSE